RRVEAQQGRQLVAARHAFDLARDRVDVACGQPGARQVAGVAIHAREAGERLAQNSEGTDEGGIRHTARRPRYGRRPIVLPAPAEGAASGFHPPGPGRTQPDGFEAGWREARQAGPRGTVIAKHRPGVCGPCLSNSRRDLRDRTRELCPFHAQGEATDSAGRNEDLPGRIHRGRVGPAGGALVRREAGQHGRPEEALRRYRAHGDSRSSGTRSTSISPGLKASVPDSGPRRRAGGTGGRAAAYPAETAASAAAASRRPRSTRVSAESSPPLGPDAAQVSPSTAVLAPICKGLPSRE